VRRWSSTVSGALVMINNSVKRGDVEANSDDSGGSSSDSKSDQSSRTARDVVCSTGSGIKGRRGRSQVQAGKEQVEIRDGRLRCKKAVGGQRIS
jgi:hypothetical protein